MVVTHHPARHPPQRLARHTAQLAGHLTGLALFVAFTLVGVRSFLKEPAASPFDAVLWVGLTGMGLFVGALTAAALVNRPLLGRSLAVETRVNMLPTRLLAGMALGIMALSFAFDRWFGAAAYALVFAGSLYSVRILPRHASTTASPDGPAA